MTPGKELTRLRQGAEGPFELRSEKPVVERLDARAGQALA
jgi:hypothetical protein